MLDQRITPNEVLALEQWIQGDNTMVPYTLETFRYGYSPRALPRLVSIATSSDFRPTRFSTSKIASVLEFHSAALHIIHDHQRAMARSMKWIFGSSSSVADVPRAHLSRYTRASIHHKSKDAADAAVPGTGAVFC